jgi:hypothetical protein
MPDKKEWTLMFYFASDNPLAPGIVSQLKALKNAGYHPEVNVIAQFDPHSPGVPVHVFDVNLVNKLKARGKCRVGSGVHAYVKNLVLDKLWGEEEEDVRRSIGEFINTHKDPTEDVSDDVDPENIQGDSLIDYDPPMPPTKMSGEQTPEEALTTFLDFCREKYPARHYMLFILGHGLIVGNDLFLFDETGKEHSLSLRDFGAVLGGFKRKLPASSEFELISFHSCSMSSLEVAYELRGTAKYMLASQGPAFVGSWPYTQIVMRVLNDLIKKERGKERTVRETIIKMFFYCLYNSYDFQLAGYSFDLCLSDLEKVSQVTEPLRALTSELRKGLASEDPRAKKLILLAHWEAQSFWHESYTDVNDFCRCLKKNCEAALLLSPSDCLDVIGNACQKVMDELKKGKEYHDNELIIRSAFAGPASQYSQGFSVFFPWAKPTDHAFWPEQYQGYIFEETGWREFLDDYFKITMRRPHQTEVNAELDPKNRPREPLRGSEESLLERITGLIFNEDGQLGKGAGSDETGNPGGGKGAGSDPTGGGCDCSSIKNYPSSTREILSPDFFEDFRIGFAKVKRG